MASKATNASRSDRSDVLYLNDGSRPRDNGQDRPAPDEKGRSDELYLALTLATAVKYFRRSMKITQSELAMKMGCHQSRISQIERADFKQGSVSFEFVCQLASRAGFDTDIAFISRESGERVEFTLCQVKQRQRNDTLLRQSDKACG